MARKSASVPNPQKEILLMTIREKFAYMVVGVLVISFFTIGVYSFATRAVLPKVLGEMQKNPKKSTDETKKPEQPTKKYTVQPGDSLSSISMNIYGTTDYSADIAKANNLDPLAFLTEGQILVLPNIATTSTPTPTASLTPTDVPTITPTITPTLTPTPTMVESKENGDLPHEAARTKRVEHKNNGFYVVQEGENLWDVAEKVYGDGKEWQKIVKDNNISNPNSVAAGTKLKTPKK